MVSIAQLVRASDCGSEGRGFDPHCSPKVVMNQKIHHHFSLSIPAILFKISVRLHRQAIAQTDDTWHSGWDLFRNNLLRCLLQKHHHQRAKRVAVGRHKDSAIDRKRGAISSSQHGATRLTVSSSDSVSGKSSSGREA